MSGKVRVGDPLDPSVKVGAIIDDRQQQKILAYIESGKDQGANLKIGGSALESNKGRFIQPTVFSDVRPDMVMSRKIEAGTVWINNFMSGYPEVSFGGFRQSGQGRELGRFSIDEFTELKSVLMHIGPSGDGWVGA